MKTTIKLDGDMAELTFTPESEFEKVLLEQIADRPVRETRVEPVRTSLGFKQLGLRLFVFAQGGIIKPDGDLTV